MSLKQRMNEIQKLNNAKTKTSDLLQLEQPKRTIKIETFSPKVEPTQINKVEQAESAKKPRLATAGAYRNVNTETRSKFIKINQIFQKNEVDLQFSTLQQKPDSHITSGNLATSDDFILTPSMMSGNQDDKETQPIKSRNHEEIKTQTNGSKDIQVSPQSSRNRDKPANYKVLRPKKINTLKRVYA